MRSLDAKSRRGVGNGKPIGGGGQALSSVGNKTSWTRTSDGGFAWVSEDPALPTATITRTAAGWWANVWPDGTSENSASLGVFKNSGLAQRASGRIINAHLKFADMGDIQLVGNDDANEDPYAQDGAAEDEDPNDDIQTTSSFSLFGADDGQDDEGPEESDDGIEEEEDPRDDESLDEEIAEDEDNSDDGDDDDDDGPVDTTDDDEGTDNPGDESDDEHIEKESSVAELQARFGLTHLAGKSYSLAEQDGLVREGEKTRISPRKQARNPELLDVRGTHYEAASGGDQSSDAQDILAFLF
jgi:hypothetical protein